MARSLPVRSLRCDLRERSKTRPERIIAPRSAMAAAVRAWLNQENVVSGGEASTQALKGSTEEDQFKH